VTAPETQDLDLLARDAVVVSAWPRELAVATGADRVRFLNGIITADVAGTAVGQGCRSALLTPKGHVVADLRLFARPDAIWIVVDAGQAESVAGSLARYAIMDDFAAARDADFAIVSVLGAKAADRLRAIGVDPGALVEAAPLAHADVAFDGGTLWLVRVRELGTPGFWLGGPHAAVEAARARLADAGVPTLAATAAEAARIAALEPLFGAEITADYFPMEVGLTGAIDYKKGCYLGQEPIVRIRDRGHINWRLVGLDVEGAEEPAAGDSLETDAKPKAGRVTSAARLPDGRGVALAMLHVSIPVGGEVRIRHGEAPLAAKVRAEA
jgi:folate-binding protein YgfZ